MTWAWDLQTRTQAGATAETPTFLPLVSLTQVTLPHSTSFICILHDFSADITSDTDTRPYHGAGSGRLTSHGPYSSQQQPHHFLPHQQHPDRPMTARGYHNLPLQRGGHRGGPPPMMDDYQQDPYQQQQQHGQMPPYAGGGPYGAPAGRQRGGGRMGGGPGPPPGGPGMGQHQRGGPGQRGGPPQERYRLFVALFDYDPPSMSPNPDACDEELPFREGQMIKVTETKTHEFINQEAAALFFNRLCICALYFADLR